MKYKLKPQFLNISNETAFFSIYNLKDHTSALKKDFEFFKDWIADGKNADMHYLEQNEHARLDPTQILPNAKTAFVFLFPYATGKKVRGQIKQPEQIHARENSLYAQKLIAKYAHFKDYHKIIKKYLNQYALLIEKDFGKSFSFRPIVDSVPFFERAVARESGLGFIGKNTLLIRPGLGSFFFIGTLLTDIEISEIAEIDNKKNALYDLDCGDCTKCIDACPTQALEPNKTLNANKCLSYLTIEHRGEIPEKYKKHLKDTIFGCDICQDVCPYNLVTQDVKILNEFKKVHEPLLILTRDDLANMTKEEYEKWFGGTAITRAKYNGLLRNSK